MSSIIEIWSGLNLLGVIASVVVVVALFVIGVVCDA